MATLKPKIIKPLNIRFPLKKSFGGAFQTNNVTVDAIADDLKILILTNHGERPMNFTFGANLRSLLFEQDSEISQKISDRLSAAIDVWMPFLTIRSIAVTTNKDDPSVQEYTAKIKVEFFVGQTDLDGSITVTARA